MGPLSYIIAFVCIGLAAYYWFTNNQATLSTQSTSSSSRKTTKRTNFLDFDKECRIRTLTPSDLQSVEALVKGKGGCGYFRDHSLTPYLDSSDGQHLSFGVEHVASGKVICTQFIAMVDGNETGLVLGAMFDVEYRSSIRVCYMRLSNDIQDKLSSRFEHLGKHRTLSAGGDYAGYCNNAELDWRTKFNLDSMTDDDVYFVLNTTGTSDDSEDGVKVNVDFVETEDVGMIIGLLTTWKVENVLIDWSLFQTKCVHSVLTEGIGSKTMTLLVNKEKSALALVHEGQYYYIYGKSSDDVLSVIRFALSQGTEKKDGNLGVFVSKSMVGDNAEIRTLFGKATEHPVVGLDYDMHIDGH